MTLTSNQFQRSNIKGRLDEILNLNQFRCIVDASETATLVPGDPVKLKDITGNLIIIEKATALTDDIFGFVPYSVDKNEYIARDILQIASRDCVMIMEASAAIARGAAVQINFANGKVATKTGTNTAIGIALEKALADTNLIKVWIQTPRMVDEDLVGLTSSIAELNKLTGVTTTTAQFNKLDTTAETETITTGAISVTKRITKLDTTAGATLFTLAAPDISMLGQTKIINFSVDNGDATLALTNVQGGSAGALATFANVGEELVLVAGVSKWNVVSEGGVVLS
jgi:hypothetical protein